MPQSILYIDLETTPQGKINDVGALFNNKEYHQSGFGPIEDWIKETRYVCGHNILAHDIPILKERFGEATFKDKVLIDTLLWSPILFADHPYHKLVKGYKLINDQEYSNPLSDCILTKQLLQDELNAFGQLNKELKTTYYNILNKDVRYSWLFDILQYQPDPNLEMDYRMTPNLINRICLNSNWSKWLGDNPAALTYALAIINAQEENSACSSWVLHNEPDVQTILDELRFRSCDDPVCSYCNEELDPRKALERYFGYENFRSFDPGETISIQERTVRAGLRNESFVAVFPTGGGKSLTFQLPALMKGSLMRQLTVVISPLVSLMKDQVDNLQERFGIMRAVAINGLLSPLERQEAIEQVADGSAHILYISPEALRSPTITRLLKNRGIARFVIDEAHCFSSWGQDFRVDYLFIGEFIKQLLEHNQHRYQIPVSCFTATAKPQVIKDIQAYFLDRLDLDLAEYVTRAERKNLQYEVIPVENPDEKIEALLDLLQECKTPAIVYASRTKKVEELAETIQKAGMSAAPFHGQMERDDKIRNQNGFMEGNTDIIVATSAFGMGVDKDDVQSVIHFNISNSLENYLQEAGRAGRKESIQAKCYILFHEDDLSKHFSLLQTTKINQKEVQQIWMAVKRMTKFRDKVSQSALQIAKQAGWDTEMRDLGTKVKTSLAALEDKEFVVRTQNSPIVFANSLMVRKIDKAIEILNTAKSLSERQKQNCTRILQRLVKEDECRVDYLADTLDLKMGEVQESINNLRELELLGDKKDLTAFINMKKSTNGSRKIIERITKLEKALLEQLPNTRTKASLRQLNQKLLDNNIELTGIDGIKTILDYWDLKGFIKKQRIDRERDIYELFFRNRDQLEEHMSDRHELAGFCYQELEKLYKVQSQQVQRKEDIPVNFSLLELRKSNQFYSGQDQQTIKPYEQALLFLHHIKAIKLEGGFMVIYNRLNVTRVKEPKNQFTQKDYQKLGDHYSNKIQQIHIVGEYARKRLENYEKALTYVNDYFRLPYEEFLSTYFPRRKTEITRAITPKKFQDLIGYLDSDQTNIIKDNKSSNILVLAGPGSGKTKVLVHKIASLLILEDVKPEQFLMLTFSKAASLEFRSRVYDLVPEFAGMIKIATFHGYCFELLGQLGDLEKSENIIEICIEAIGNEDIDISSIANKSVLLLDEFQDVNGQEWKLIQTIIQTAESIRVIAVGDDDQNIYGFRGSSIEYMKRFHADYSATQYNLIKNYRSREGIIQFNNILVKSISERLKEENLIPPKRTNQAKVKVVKYCSNHLIAPIVKDVEAIMPKGSTALLTRTNSKALLAATLLKEAGFRVKLIAGIEDFSLRNLLEMRIFQKYLEDVVTDVGLIVADGWEQAKTKFEEYYGDSLHYSWCMEIIHLFESQFTSDFEIVEWRDYIKQIKAEDAIHGESNTVVVSTMHKSKGKEFDNVFLMLEDYRYDSDENKRLLYVACSRAKERLVIHINNRFFSDFEVDGLHHYKYDKPTSPPDHFDLVLNLREVDLASQTKYQRARSIIQTLKTGDQLRMDEMEFAGNIALGLAPLNQGNMLLFSRKFMSEKYPRIKKGGYHLEDAHVEYIVHWYNKDLDREYRVVIPRLHFKLGPQEG